MESEDETPKTNFDFIVVPDTPEEDEGTTWPVENPAIVEEDPETNPNIIRPRTSAEMLGIYLMIKAVRRGDFGQGDEREEILLSCGFPHNAVLAVIHEADNPK